MREHTQAALCLLLVGFCALLGEWSRRQAYREGGAEAWQQARAWVNLGLSHVQAGDMVQARECWEVALSYPEGNGYYHRLAHINLRKLAQIEGREEDMWRHDREVKRLRRERDERVRRFWYGRTEQ